MEQILFTSFPIEEVEQRLKVILDQKLQEHLSPILTQQESRRPEYVTRKEAAQLLKVSLVTLHDWQKQGIVKAYRISSRIRFKLLEIEQALNLVRTR